MNFKQYLFDDVTAWGQGGSFERQLSDIKGQLSNLSPIDKDKVDNFKNYVNKKKEIKTKDYQSKKKGQKSGLESQIQNTEVRLEQIRDKIVQVEQVIGKMKENSANSKSVSQKEGIKRQIEGYVSQLKILHNEAKTLLQRRSDLIEKHNDALQRKREAAQSQQDTQYQGIDRREQQKAKEDESPKFDPHGFGIERPLKPEIPQDWTQFTEADVNKLKEYYRDMIQYNEKLRQKTAAFHNPNISKNSITYAGIIARLQQEIVQLDKDWQDLKAKQMKKQQKKRE